MAVPLQTWVGKQFGRLRVRTAGKTDRRIRLMNEIVNGLKVIKMYTWEEPFARLVHKARKVQNPELWNIGQMVKIFACKKIIDIVHRRRSR